MCTCAAWTAPGQSPESCDRVTETDDGGADRGVGWDGLGGTGAGGWDGRLGRGRSWADPSEYGCGGAGMD